MRNILKISLITILLIVFCSSFVFAADIDMNLQGNSTTDTNQTTTNETRK